MSNPIYKTMKVFDSQWNPGMPEDVKRGFFRIFMDRAHNDVFVEYSINGEVFSPEDEKTEWCQDKIRLDAWLVENGADPGGPGVSGETAIIKHWW